MKLSFVDYIKILGLTTDVDLRHKKTCKPSA